ncbi:MAG: hypothetical protein U0169_03095 [Polyangiaceae bacterium]
MTRTLPVLASAFALVAACNGTGSTSRDDDFPTDACTTAEDCPRVGCICQAKDASERVIYAALCRTSRCAVADDLCSAACQAATPPGTWNGKVEQLSVSDGGHDADGAKDGAGDAAATVDASDGSRD